MDVDTPEPVEILARATVSFRGIRAGHDYFVDPSVPWIRQALDDGLLVVIPDEPQ